MLRSKGFTVVGRNVSAVVLGESVKNSWSLDKEEEQPMGCLP